MERWQGLADAEAWLPRTLRKGNVFTFLSVHVGGGGRSQVPSRGRGYPSLWSQVLSGGYPLVLSPVIDPVPGLTGGGGGQRGVPSQDRSTPYPGTGQGYPLPPPILSRTCPSTEDKTGYPPPSGGGAWEPELVYATGGKSLALTQEDFLVLTIQRPRRNKH